jgi:hypothetical protein
MFCYDFKCFSDVFQTYVVSVVSEYFKSKSGVASPSSRSDTSARYLLLLLRRLLPLFSILVTFGMVQVSRGRAKRREKKGLQALANSYLEPFPASVSSVHLALGLGAAPGDRLLLRCNPALITNLGR